MNAIRPYRADRLRTGSFRWRTEVRHVDAQWSAEALWRVGEMRADSPSLIDARAHYARLRSGALTNRQLRDDRDDVRAAARARSEERISHDELVAELAFAADDATRHLLRSPANARRLRESIAELERAQSDRHEQMGATVAEVRARIANDTYVSTKAAMFDPPGTPGRTVPGQRELEIVARIRLRADQRLGRETPAWIRIVAEQSMSAKPSRRRWRQWWR